jgi:hypothetical protein
MTANPYALIPAEIIETATEIAAYNTTLWRKMLRDMAITVVGGESDSLEAAVGGIWKITQLKYYAEMLDDGVEEMKQFAVDDWPDLDLRAQKFIARLFWMLRSELPDFP